MAKMRTVAGLAAAFCLFAAARGDVEDFFGNWENAGRTQAASPMSRSVRPAAGPRGCRVYGDCHPIECNWGMVEGKSYTADPRSEDVQSISAVFSTGFVRKEIILRKGQGDLSFEMLTEFVDGSERHDFDMTGRLKHSAWAGPVGQSWDGQINAGTGWGGGARSGASPAPQETCSGFDAAGVRVASVGALWNVTAATQLLAQAGERDARRVAEVIRHYRLNNKCHVGKLAYWKRGAAVPSGGMGGADCIFFNPTTVHGTRMGHAWKIVDGVQWIANFGTDNTSADKALALIRFYRLGAECYVGPRLSPAMIYWLAR